MYASLQRLDYESEFDEGAPRIAGPSRLGGAVSERLRRLDDTLGIDHNGGSEWIWGVPAFIFVAISGPLVPRLRASRVAGAFLDGVNVASLALMAVVTVQLGRAAVVDLPTALLALAAAIALLRFKLNATWLMLAGAALGIGLHLVGLNR